MDLLSLNRAINLLAKYAGPQDAPKEKDVGIKVWKKNGFTIEYRYDIHESPGRDNTTNRREKRFINIRRSSEDNWGYDVIDDKLVPIVWDENDRKPPFNIAIREKKSGKDKKTYCVINFDDGEKFSFPLDIVNPKILNW